MVYWVVNADVLTRFTSILPLPFNVPAPLMTCPVAPGIKEPLTVMVPPTLKLLPLVTVAPEFIVKLLKLEKIVEGKVVVPANIKVPVPGVQTFVTAVFIVISPFKVSVPPLVIVIVPIAGVVAVPPKKRLLAAIEEPVAKLMVPVLLELPDPPTVKLAEILSEIFAFMLSVPLLEVELPTCKLPQTALAETVTVKPRSIKTRSPARGAEAPAEPPEDVDQVLVAFQLPVATE